MFVNLLARVPLRVTLIRFLTEQNCLGVFRVGQEPCHRAALESVLMPWSKVLFVGARLGMPPAASLSRQDPLQTIADWVGAGPQSSLGIQACYWEY